MDSPMEIPVILRIGAIIDELPADMSVEEKPTTEEIAKFKDLLYEELAFVEFISMTDKETVDAIYEVRGEIIDFRRGSGVLRFAVGFGLGNSRLVVALKLVNTTTGEIFFAGNFADEVSTWLAQSDRVYESVAFDFARALKKHHKKALIRK